jgi:nitrate reductase alpha subunit
MSPAKATIRTSPGKMLVFCGPPPLIAGENAEHYDRLLDAVADVVKPVDILEWFWVREVVDLHWEIDRNRRIKANVINGARQGAILDLLPPSDDPCVSEGNMIRAERFARRDEETVKEVEELLTVAEVTQDMIVARAVVIRIGEITRLDQMIATEELRRNIALREIQHHRETFGKQLRRAIDVVDADYQVVEGKHVDERVNEEKPSQGRLAA